MKITHRVGTRKGAIDIYTQKRLDDETRAAFDRGKSQAFEGIEVEDLPLAVRYYIEKLELKAFQKGYVEGSEVERQFVKEKVRSELAKQNKEEHAQQIRKNFF